MDDRGEARSGSWAGEVCDLVRRAFLQDDPRWWGQWEARPGILNASATLQALPGCSVLDYEGPYSLIELNGSWCEQVGNEGLSRLLAEVEASGWRWTSSRSDVAWDGFPWGVLGVRDALNDGRVFTRMKIDRPVPFFENAEGRTVYTGKREREKVIRWYDRRGPVRCELELKGESSTAFVKRLAQTPVEEWGRVAMAVLRGTIEFADGDRADCARPLSWWSQFVGDVDGERLVRAPRDTKVGSEVGRIDAQIGRNHRWIVAAVEAYGVEWLVDRARHYRGLKVSHEEVERLRVVLEKARGSGMCGAPDYDDGDGPAPF